MISPNMRILIAEEGVKTNAGHWAPYSKTIAEGLSAIGVSATVAGHVDADASVREGMPFEPVFRYSRWDGHYEHRPWLERKALVALHNWRLYKDMAAFLERSPPFDCIFCGNILVYHSFAWQMLARRFLGKEFHHLILMMVQPAGVLNPEQGNYVFPARSKALAWSLSKTVGHGCGRVSLAAETPAAQKEFSQLTGKAVNLFHHPVKAPLAIAAQSRQENGRTVRLVCPGFARYEKGSDILLEAIRITQGQAPDIDLRFRMQWKNNHRFETPCGHQISADRDLENQGLVEYLTNELKGDDYWQFLADADIIILPYRCNPYTTRLSRVAIEALIMGKPVIYTRGSWLDFAVNDSGCGVGFEDGSAKSLAAAITEACSKLASLRAAASAKAATAAEHYSPERFAERLKQLSDPRKC